VFLEIGRLSYRLRDGGIVKLCKVHHISRDISRTAGHTFTGVLSTTNTESSTSLVSSSSSSSVSLTDLQAEGKGHVAIAWLTHDPGRQLLTGKSLQTSIIIIQCISVYIILCVSIGSFHPIDDDQWQQRHEWQKGIEPVDLSGNTLTSVMLLLQRRYSLMASHGLTQLLPMIPRTHTTFVQTRALVFLNSYTTIIQYGDK
jgi:hypothetical protein